MTTKDPRILGVEEVEAFVRYELFDPERHDAIVALTTRSGEPEPLIPPARLVQELAGKARVVVIPTGVVPQRLGVYGGAVRVWMPGLAPGADPFVHPLLMVFTQEDVARVIARIRSILGIAEPERELVPVPVADVAPPPPLQLSTREEELERECRDLARDREELLQRAEKLHDELKKVRLEVQELRKRLRTAGASSASAPADDPTSSPARFLAAVCEAYAAMYPPADARQFPLRVTSDQFLESVQANRGGRAGASSGVCAHGVGTRARDRQPRPSTAQRRPRRPPTRARARRRTGVALRAQGQRAVGRTAALVGAAGRRGGSARVRLRRAARRRGHPGVACRDRGGRKRGRSPAGEPARAIAGS
jgi:hypothetical protein